MQYRQGDVLLETIDEFPPEATPVARKRGRLILAEGESTGHAHAITSRHACALECAGVMYLLLLRQAQLLHEEHGKITLPAGRYLVRRPHEYTPQEIRRVND